MLGFINFLSTWNITIEFPNEASMYMFHLIGLHNRIMYYLTMVIVFMCVILGFILTNIIARVRSYWIILWYMNYTPFCLDNKACVIYYFIKSMIFSAKWYGVNCFPYITDKYLSKVLNYPKDKVLEYYIIFVQYLLGFYFIRKSIDTLDYVDVRANIRRIVRKKNVRNFTFFLRQLSNADISYDSVNQSVHNYYLTKLLRGRNKNDVVVSTTPENILEQSSVSLTSNLSNLSYLGSSLDLIAKKAPLSGSRRTHFYKAQEYIKAATFRRSLLIEFLWAAWPVTIICSILYPSFVLIKLSDAELFEPDYHLKVQGYQWYWGYDIHAWRKFSDMKNLQYLFDRVVKFMTKIPQFDEVVEMAYLDQKEAIARACRASEYTLSEYMTMRAELFGLAMVPYFETEEFAKDAFMPLAGRIIRTDKYNDFWKDRCLRGNESARCPGLYMTPEHFLHRMVTSDYTNPYHRILFTYMTDRFIRQHELDHPDYLIFRNNFIARELIESFDKFPQRVVSTNEDILDAFSIESFAELKETLDDFINKEPYSAHNGVIIYPFHETFPVYDNLECFSRPSQAELNEMDWEDKYRVFPYHSFYIRKMFLLNGFSEGHIFTRDIKDDMYCDLYKGLLRDYDTIWNGYVELLFSRIGPREIFYFLFNKYYPVISMLKWYDRLDESGFRDGKKSMLIDYSIVANPKIDLTSVNSYSEINSKFVRRENVLDRRLLTTDEELVVPTNTPIKFFVSSNDVLHSWAVPKLGIKLDAVPGRSNAGSTWILKPGLFTGQCSEICGPNHYLMPINIRAVSPDEYDKYLEEPSTTISMPPFLDPELMNFKDPYFESEYALSNDLWYIYSALKDDIKDSSFWIEFAKCKLHLLYLDHERDFLWSIHKYKVFGIHNFLNEELRQYCRKHFYLEKCLDTKDITVFGKCWDVTMNIFVKIGRIIRFIIWG